MLYFVAIELLLAVDEREFASIDIVLVTLMIEMISAFDIVGNFVFPYNSFFTIYFTNCFLDGNPATLMLVMIFVSKRQNIEFSLHLLLAYINSDLIVLPLI